VTQLITAAELAKHLNLSEDAVYKMALRGDIPSYKFGNKVRFDLEEVRASNRRGVA
jgi:excisionase family DNA binding protein